MINYVTPSNWLSVYVKVSIIEKKTSPTDPKKIFFH